jgi:multiple sugar transport system substrate-binding protein
MDDQEKRADLLTGQVSRREVLKKGLIGAAGLTVLPTVLAACGGSSATPTAAPPAATPAGPVATPATGPTGTPAAAALTGKVSLGSNLSDAVPKKALADAVAAFQTANAGVTVTINTVDHTTFQTQISNYLGATPQDVITWFSGYRMRAFVVQGFFVDVSDLWAGDTGKRYTDAFKTACTAADGKQYMMPFDTYAWTVYYVPSVWKAKGYTVPTTLADMKTLAAKMLTDKLVPIGLGQKDGWPAMGHFDIIDLRENGYQFHVDLMSGKNKWTDPKVLDVFTVWKDLLPYYQAGAAGRLWQDAAAGLVAKTTGMMLQPQVVQTFQAAGAAALADLDFFPWPNHGKGFDDEAALDAPIDGFMITAKSPSKDADMANSKALMEFLGQGSTQVIYAGGDTSLIATANNADQGGYTPLQKKQVAVIAAAKKLTQFLDRDSNPAFTGPNGMGSFLIDFLSNPNQDLTAFLAKIQKFQDSLSA